MLTPVDQKVYGCTITLLVLLKLLIGVCVAVGIEDKDSNEVLLCEPLDTVNEFLTEE